MRATKRGFGVTRARLAAAGRARPPFPPKSDRSLGGGGETAEYKGGGVQVGQKSRRQDGEWWNVRNGQSTERGRACATEGGRLMMKYSIMKRARRLPAAYPPPGLPGTDALIRPSVERPRAARSAACNRARGRRTYNRIRRHQESRRCSRRPPAAAAEHGRVEAPKCGAQASAAEDAH